MNKYIKSSIQFINENSNIEKNLVLYHGSSNRDIYTNFHDNQFYTVNDYIASNYAYNLGGILYEVTVSHLNPFELGDYDKNKVPDKYNYMCNLLKLLYNDEVVKNYQNRWFFPSPSSTFMQYGWTPIINWAKNNGYDSLKFIDESFDTYVTDTTYVIFKDDNVKIQNVYDVTDAVESRFVKEYVSIK